MNSSEFLQPLVESRSWREVVADRWSYLSGYIAILCSVFLIVDTVARWRPPATWGEGILLMMFLLCCCAIAAVFELAVVLIQRYQRQSWPADTSAEDQAKTLIALFFTIEGILLVQLVVAAFWFHLQRSNGQPAPLWLALYAFGIVSTQMVIPIRALHRWASGTKLPFRLGH